VFEEQKKKGEEGSGSRKMSGMRRNVFYCSDRRRAISFGIIDILQPYDLKKKMETRIKSFMYDEKTISAVPPEDYKKRFVEFISRVIRGGGEKEKKKKEVSE
jgi:hypothetical protein